MSEDKTFGEMSVEEKLEIFHLQLLGIPLQWKKKEGDTWYFVGNKPNPISFHGSPELCYRKAPLVMGLPWESLDDSWKWAAKDENGKIFLYTAKPSLGAGSWGTGGGKYFEVFASQDDRTSILKIVNTDVFWKYSLEERPANV